MAAKRNALSAVLGMKCPKCRQGDIYKNKSIFPLKEMMIMPERCANCGQKTEIEIGFYYGTGYVSYGLSIAIGVFNLVWFALFVGLSWKDSSVYWYLGVTVVMLILLQPLIMRLARSIYFSMFVPYDPIAGKTKNEKTQIANPNLIANKK